MSEIVITVENLSKRYLVGHQDGARRAYTLHYATSSLAKPVLSRARRSTQLRGRQIVQGDEIEEFWALKDVSFRGEARRGHWHYRSKWRRKKHPAEDPQPNYGANQGPRTLCAAEWLACLKLGLDFIWN